MKKLAVPFIYLKGLKVKNCFSPKLSTELLPPSIHFFAGYSSNMSNRFSGSSGGVGTTILQYLLDTQKVDGVIGVGFDDKDKTKCVYKLVEHSSDVITLAGSKYVYMELDPLLKLLYQNRHKRLAVVVEPCFVKPIKKWAPHCQYILSFFCGYNITPKATEYLIKKSNVKKSDIYAIEYRGGKYPGGFSVHLKNGTSKFFTKEHWELVDLLFLREGCHKCRLFISNTADIVLGDAWIKNLHNATLILVNTKKGDMLIEDIYKKKLIALYDIRKDQVLKMHAHNLKYKNFGHSFFMRIVVKLFNNRMAPYFSPFHLLGFASKIRRILMVGIKRIELTPTKKYTLKEEL